MPPLRTRSLFGSVLALSLVACPPRALVPKGPPPEYEEPEAPPDPANTADAGGSLADAPAPPG